MAQYDMILIDTYRCLSTEVQCPKGTDALPAPVPRKPLVQSWPLPTAGGIDQSGAQEARTVGPHGKQMTEGAAGESG